MDQPAQTLNYMVAGYVVILGTLLGYLASLANRWKKTIERHKALKTNE